MSSHYEYLLKAIKRYQTDNVHKRVEKLSNEQIKHLSKNDESLLDVAASKSQSDIMAILISKGIIKWNGSKENNQVFIALIEDYKKDRNIDKKPIDRKQIDRMNVLKRKNTVSETSEAIRVLLEYQRKWLARKLRGTARVRNIDDIIGHNICWRIDKTWEDAYDSVTGRKIRLKQMLFKGRVEIILYDTEREWTVTIQGTVENVLKKIYLEFQPIPEGMGDGTFFEGLSKKGDKYVLDLGS